MTEPMTQMIPAATAARPVWQSKTAWVAVATALVSAIAPMMPGIGPVISGAIAANPELATALGGGAVSLIFGAMRLMSHGKVTIAQK